MTTAPVGPVTDVAAAAQEQARQAAAAAGVRTVPLTTTDEVRTVLPVIEAVWGPSDIPPPNLLRALAHAGAVVLAAEPVESVAGAEGIVGFALGFLGWRGGLHLHSHQVAVLPAAHSRGIGYALKLAQRAECLQQGVTDCRWTFDPLLIRNARFNFQRLGVRGVAFLPECYGQMEDAINRADVSDRFEVSWWLTDPVRARAAESGPPLITTAPDGYPRRTPTAVDAGVCVAVPADYATLRTAGDPRAAAWRSLTREVFTECFSAGLVADSLGPDGYRFTPDRKGRP